MSNWLSFQLFYLLIFFFTILCDSSIWLFTLFWTFVWGIIRFYVWNCTFSFRVLSDLSYLTKSTLKLFVMFVLCDC